MTSETDLQYIYLAKGQIYKYGTEIIFIIRGQTICSLGNPKESLGECRLIFLIHWYSLLMQPSR